MKKLIMFFGFISQLFSSKAQLPDFNKYPVYKGNDLGLTYSPDKSVLRIWSPVAERAELLVYEQGSGGLPVQTFEMSKRDGGIWISDLKGDYKGKFYVFRIMINKSWMDEVPDPYAKIVGINGYRAMIADLKESNPAGWENDKSVFLRHATNAVIYELHIRDASIAANSGIIHKGKFKGLTEKGTKNESGLSTGLDHLKELGVTHIHLLPFFDYNSVDETKPDAKYNWGYDPLNYNAPEGSYSTSPYDGITRIKELKELIQTLHANGLNVVMDVVYNHTALTEKSYFNQLVPGYYYRQTPAGKFSNATACGNETASERPMMRKFILESMKFWVQEYHIDGFRVDLMGVHDIATMNIISKELHRLNPGILIYGEGWTAGSSPLPDSLRALKKTAYKLDHIAVFSDDIRDGIKGSVFRHEEPGFASGKTGLEESIKFGVVAACKHPQVNYKKVNYSKKPYAAAPYNTISYCECHDNHTLWDKLAISSTDTGEPVRRQMHKLALSIVLTSQGIAFLHAGTEFLRSKRGVENSFDSPDSINAIDWNLKTKNKDIYDYVMELINMRKAHPAFHMHTAKQIAANIHFLKNTRGNVIAYSINGQAVNDSWKKIFVVYNGSAKEQSLSLPEGKWRYFQDPGTNKKNISGKTNAAPWTCTILYQR
jgi:pullulanase